MRIYETKVFKFNELSHEAKEHARVWFRELEAGDMDFDFVLEDAVTIGEMLGVDFKQHPVKLMNGATIYKPVIYYSGFSSQGDGACFEGRYTYKVGSTKAIKAHAPKDEVLYRIASGLLEVQKRYGYRAVVDMQHKGRYSHSYSVEFTDNEREMKTEDFDAVCGLLREFMDWIYRQLEAEYNYRLADEQVDEAINANEYEFTEDGGQAD